MPLRLAAPIEKSFVLDKSDALYGNDGSPTTASFRQASFRGNSRRRNIFSEWKRELNADGKEIVIMRWSWDEVKLLDIFLTMTACNILGMDGKELFRFKNNRLDMSEQEFISAVGELRDEVVDELHDKCLEVNSDWQVEGEVSLGES
jgi:hypothetical protein